MSIHHFCALFICLGLLPVPAATVYGRQDRAITIVATAEDTHGVGSLGYGSSEPGSPPRSSYGNNPNDYRRGYEGNSPYPGDPWNRETDFKARNYQQRHEPEPQYASPPDAGPARSRKQP